MPTRLREVDEPALQTVVERAFRNYSRTHGRAGIRPDKRRAESPSRLPLSLESIQKLTWAPEGRAVLAVVVAQDARGVRYTLAYEMDVSRTQGRWEIAAVQTDPDA